MYPQPGDAFATGEMEVWADEPGHNESWTEAVEDMSIAVGEDLFPFFRKIGTTLDRDRLERIEFQGLLESEEVFGTVVAFEGQGDLLFGFTTAVVAVLGQFLGVVVA